MSVLDEASLVLIPSGYKASKLYSVVPSSGDGDLDFSRSTTATRVNESGLIETVGINVPRIDFTGGGCGKLLIEPQRTNLYLNSATLATQNVTTAAASYSISFYGTGTVTFTGTYSGSLVGTGVGDRVTLTFTATSGTLTSTISGSCTNAQLEAGSYATSYIPTAGTSVTRGKDASSTSGLSSLIGQTEGTIFLDLNLVSQPQQYLWIGQFENRIIILLDNLNFKIIIQNAGSYDLSVVVNTLVDGSRNKIGFAYKNNDVKVYLNGVAEYTNTSVSIPTSTLGEITFFQFYSQVNQLILSDYLTDTQLAELTTL